MDAEFPDRDKDGNFFTFALPKRVVLGEAAFELAVIEGPDRGAALHLQGEGVRFSVGTSESCSLRVGDRSVSRRHFVVCIEGGVLRIEDLESTNGVWVDSVRVYQAQIGDRSRIRAGATVFEAVRVNANDTNLSRDESFGRVLGVSPAMRRLYPTFATLAQSSVPILIEGEPGTGKELLAEVLHDLGAWKDAAFTSCDGTSESIEATLFGKPHAPGLLLQPGTVLLRNLSYLPLALQQRLANALDRRNEGGATVTARVVATSRRDVDVEVQHGRADEGLASIFGRARVELPALRAREGDIRLLANHFWRTHHKMTTEIPRLTMQRFESFRWHGNVAELQVAVTNLAVSGTDNVDPTTEFRRDNRVPIGEIAERLLSADLPMIQARTLLGEAFDRRYLERILAAHNGNLSRAAAASGVARRYFYTLKMKHASTK
jgi:two-component system, NtrC family, response regulator HydG